MCAYLGSVSGRGARSRFGMELVPERIQAQESCGHSATPVILELCASGMVNQSGEQPPARVAVKYVIVLADVAQ
jgi:hypothetical protein